MRPTAIAALALLTAGLCAQGGAPAAASPGKAAYDRFVAEHNAATAAYMAEVRKLTATDEYKEAMQARNAEKMAELRKHLQAVDNKAFAERALASAAEFTGDERVPFLAWALQNGSPDIAKTVAAQLLADHVGSRALLPVVEMGSMLLQKLGQDGGREFLAAVASKASDREVKAYATYWPAMFGMRAKDADEATKAALQKQIDAARQLAEGTLLADRIDAPQFVKDRLQIGMVAPDIEGEDMDGVPFKLSDYRGKVVVLDFWGFW